MVARQGLAARTPAARNRYVDFLRATSIVVVVIGHWLMAAPSFERGEFTLSDMLRIAPRTQWLTWIFQVMPLFFIVGGYGNSASWEKARGSGEGYAAWVSRRFQRLVRPMIPVVAVWSGDRHRRAEARPEPAFDRDRLAGGAGPDLVPGRLRAGRLGGARDLPALAPLRHRLLLGARRRGRRRGRCLAGVRPRSGALAQLRIRLARGSPARLRMAGWVVRRTGARPALGRRGPRGVGPARRVRLLSRQHGHRSGRGALEQQPPHAWRCWLSASFTGA